MDNQKLYYGLPQIIWDDLCEKAEDLLQEENLGNHLVGIYPAGNRIYGLELASPGLLCLYVNSIEPMIDPLSDYHQDPELGFNVYHVGHSNSPIIMVDLWWWIRWMFSSTHSYLHRWRFYSMLHAIPFGDHVLYEEESICGIMEACYKGLQETGFLACRQNLYTAQHTKNYTVSKKLYDELVPLRYLYARAVGILQGTLALQPNINEEWDTVFKKIYFNDAMYVKIPVLSNDIDERICKNILANNGVIQTDNDIHFAAKLNPNNAPLKITYSTVPTEETLKRISKETMDFYRFQL